MQYIKRKTETLCDAEIKLVSISKAGKLEKFPKTLIKPNKSYNFFTNIKVN